jgi:hypothetical protein
MTVSAALVELGEHNSWAAVWWAYAALYHGLSDAALAQAARWLRRVDRPAAARAAALMLRADIESKIAAYAGKEPPTQTQRQLLEEATLQAPIGPLRTSGLRMRTRPPGTQAQHENMRRWLSPSWTGNPPATPSIPRLPEKPRQATTRAGARNASLGLSRITPVRRGRTGFGSRRRHAQPERFTPHFRPKAQPRAARRRARSGGRDSRTEPSHPPTSRLGAIVCPGGA